MVESIVEGLQLYKAGIPIDCYCMHEVLFEGIRQHKE